MATLISPAQAAPASDPIWRLTVDQYHAMIDTGILSSDSPVELVEGILLQKMSKKPPHSFATEEARVALSSVLPPGWSVRAQEPITLADSEPEPDIAVARGSNRDYLKRHPGPADIALIVEVSDSTIARDRGIKLRMYARAGIREYWIVDLLSRCIEVHTDPQGESYRVLRVLSANEAIPVTIGGSEVGSVLVSSLLP